MIDLGRVSEQTKGVPAQPYYEDLATCKRGGFELGGNCPPIQQGR